MTRRNEFRGNRRTFLGTAAGCGAALLCGARSANGQLDASNISACTERVVDAREGEDSEEKMKANFAAVQALAFGDAASDKNEDEYKANIPAGAPSAIPPTTFGPQQIALTKSLLWSEDLSALNIRLRKKPEKRIDDAIQAAMAAWQPHIPFTLKIVSGSQHIGIDFQGSGHWSYVGVSSKRHQHSMNLQPGLPKENYKRVALHEFGHALGAIHEHQSPEVTIDWDTDAVFDYYKRTQRWSEQMTKQQVLDKYADRSQFNASAYDSTSIMQYPIPQELLKSGKAVEWNDTLSLNDKKFMRSSYGVTGEIEGDTTAKPDKPQELDARAKLKESDAVELGMKKTLEGRIDKAGELKLYRFVISAETPDVVIETVDDSPAADMVIELHKGAPFAKDKALAVSEKLKGRRLLNGYLQQKLEPGRYFAVVRHSIFSRTAAFKLHLRETKDAPQDPLKKIFDEIDSIQKRFKSAKSVKK